MLKIKYHASHFPAKYDKINGVHNLDVTWAELVWAAMSVGRIKYSHMFRHGRFSVFEIIYRIAFLYANLTENKNGNLLRSSAYNGLDPSEKSMVSYSLGLILSKVFSQQLLNMPWLGHFDIYRDEFGAILRGRSRPDLIGKNKRNEWVVMESKGRTNGFDAEALIKAKNQASQVIEISRHAPILNIGLQTHFGDGKLQVVAEDPIPNMNSKQSIRLNLSHEEFWHEYYRLFRQWMTESSFVEEISLHNNNYKQIEIKEFDLKIGLAEQLIDMQKVPDRWPIYDSISNDNVFVGMDGLLVEVGDLWSSENMKLDPFERH